MSARTRLLLALAWLALLLLGGWALSGRLQLSGDLRKFMPEARTPAQHLLMEELGEGPGSRLLLLAIGGADPATLARQSQALREALSGAPQFALFANGSAGGLESIPERLRPYRYLLSDSFDDDASKPFGRTASAAQLAGAPISSTLAPSGNDRSTKKLGSKMSTVKFFCATAFSSGSVKCSARMSLSICSQ